MSAPVAASFRLPTFRAVVEFDSYGGVLVLILLTYVLTINLTQSWGPSVILVIQIATVTVILRISRAHHTIRIVAGVCLAVAFVAAVLALILHHDIGERFLPAVSGLLYLIAPLSVIRHLMRRSVVDQETVMGAVAAYLLIGMFFAFVYRSAAANQVTPFFGTEGHGTFNQDLFFSFTTLTTTGYGNLVPASNPGQSLALAEMLIGQLFLVTAVAKVINSYKRGTRTRGDAREADPGVGDEDPGNGDE